MATRTRTRNHLVSITEPTPNSSEWLTVDEACEIVRISRRTFERHMARGTGPRISRRQTRGAIRIRRQWLDEWMDEGAA